MQRRQSKLHLFDDRRIAKEKERVQAEAVKLEPGPERDELLRKIRQIETASHINEWISSPGCNRRAKLAAPLGKAAIASAFFQWNPA